MTTENTKLPPNYLEDIATAVVLDAETKYLQKLMVPVEHGNKCGCPQCDKAFRRARNTFLMENARLYPRGQHDEEEDILLTIDSRVRLNKFVTRKREGKK